MNEHHLILGGCGSIGRHGALVLARAGHRQERPLEVSRTETRAFDVPVSVLAIERAPAVPGCSPGLSFSDGHRLHAQDLRREVRFSTLDDATERSSR